MVSSMNSMALIKTFTDSAVIIDDGYEPVVFEKITAEHWAEQRDVKDLEGWNLLQKKYALEVDRPIDLKRDEHKLRKAWDLYEGNQEEFSVLDPIFLHLISSREIDIKPLHALVSYLEKDLGLKIFKHPSIASATDDIKRCKLVFLDFYLFQKSAEQIVEAIGEFNDLFSAPIMEGKSEHSRFVFLISTDLPAAEMLEKFRRATKLKAAFFKPVSKADLVAAWLERELNIRVSQYEDMRKLTAYLDTFSKQINTIAAEMRDEIESLELHDLAVLESMRLQKEQEHIGQYLSWLFSEALAAKIRESAPLLGAASDVNTIKDFPFHGTLITKPVLFDLYSEIAFSFPLRESEGGKSQFGDVYSPVRSTNYSAPIINPRGNFPSFSGSPIAYPPLPKHYAISLQPHKQPIAKVAGVTSGINCLASDELLLVISPACDLLRCPIDYEITCVKGMVVKRTRNLADLFSHASVFGSTAEVFKHLMKESIDGATSYALVEWTPKRVITIRASLLQSSQKFLKRAKLNELFSHEIKEDALRRVGRVGVPVDPSFSSPLSAVIRLKKAKGVIHIADAPDENFVSGIFVVGNEKNSTKIIFSEAFLSWIDELIEALKGQGVTFEEKITAAISKVKNEGSAGLQLNKGAQLQIGGFCVRYFDEFNDAGFTDNYGIAFYPRGRPKKVQEDVEEVESAPNASETSSKKRVEVVVLETGDDTVLDVITANIPAPEKNAKPAEGE